MCPSGPYFEHDQREVFMSSLHGKEGVCLGRATDVNATQYKLKIAEVAELEPGSNNCELGSNFNVECGGEWRDFEIRGAEFWQRWS